MSFDLRPIVLAPHELEHALQGKPTLVVRPMKPQPIKEEWRWFWPCNAVRSCIEVGDPDDCTVSDCLASNSPFGGGKLWVRETWAPADADYRWVTGEDATRERWPHVFYRADGAPRNGDDKEAPPPRWLPPLSMPRHASRLLLDVGRIEARRVQSLLESMVMDTGLAPIPSNWSPDQWDTAHTFRFGDAPYKANFVCWWDERFGGRSERLWSANPWVWTAVVRRASR